MLQRRRRHDLTAIGEIGPACENPKQRLIPQGTPDLHMTAAAL
jgi:hypothetical protein